MSMEKETSYSPGSSTTLPPSNEIPYWRFIFDPGYCSEAVKEHQYSGGGVEGDPYVVNWLENDPRNPYNFSTAFKITMTTIIGINSLSGALSSSAPTGAIRELKSEFDVGDLVITFSLSLFVLGFAVGPLFWAPVCELIGRQKVQTSTYFVLTVFNAAGGASNTISAFLVTRFFAGTFASSPLVNAGGQIFDLYTPSYVGLAMSTFILAPFIGPVLGPVTGGFIAENVGWRWVQWYTTILTGTMFVIGLLTVPETYAPVLLQKRAARLSQTFNRVYKSKLEIEKGKKSARLVFSQAMSRPWLLFFMEPIVTALAVWMAIIYGTLYMFFPAFPIVYQELRGWSEGIGGLAFTGVAIGFVAGTLYAFPMNARYEKIVKEANGRLVPPEQRLVPAMSAAVAAPIGLFWFAFTCDPSISPYVSIAAGIPFGFSLIQVMLSTTNFLVDAYSIYAASALAANTILRSLFGFGFPLFADPMYRNLGIRWASAIPAFLSLACVPVPFVLWKYGARIRKKCKYSAEAERVRQMLAEKSSPVSNDPNEDVESKIIEETKNDAEQRV